MLADDNKTLGVHMNAFFAVEPLLRTLALCLADLSPHVIAIHMVKTWGITK